MQKTCKRVITAMTARIKRGKKKKEKRKRNYRKKRILSYIYNTDISTKV